MSTEGNALNRTTFVSIGISALVAATVASVASAGGARAGDEASAVAWVSCRGVAPTAAAATRCGSLRVALDRTNARSGTAKIVLARGLVGFRNSFMEI